MNQYTKEMYNQIIRRSLETLPEKALKRYSTYASDLLAHRYSDEIHYALLIRELKLLKQSFKKGITTTAEQESACQTKPLTL